jgi:hypothetical protein
MSPPGAMHLDGEQWPSKNQNNKQRRGAVEVTLKRCALMIWHSRATKMRREKAS